MNKVDKGLIVALVCALLALFASVAKIDTLNKIIDSSPICETYGLIKKTHAFDVKSEIIKIQCE